MSKSFTLRLPDDIATWIEDSAKEQGISMAKYTIQALRKQMQDKVLTPVLHDVSSVLTDVRQPNDGLDKLTSAIEALTQRLADLQLPAAPQQERQMSTTAQAKPTPAKPPKQIAPEKKAKKKTTKKGGKPAPTYLYNGTVGTIREHVVAALPQLTRSQVDRARNNINRAINGRKDQSSPTKEPVEAIDYEIERWQKM